MNHIKATHDEDRSWCGEPLIVGSFYFKDAEAAAINGQTQGRLNPCMACIDIIIKYLSYRSEASSCE